jgi:ribosomal protein S27AE
MQILTADVSSRRIPALRLPRHDNRLYRRQSGKCHADQPESDSVDMLLVQFARRHLAGCAQGQLPAAYAKRRACGWHVLDLGQVEPPWLRGGRLV